jgi:hypothetical protein
MDRRRELTVMDMVIEVDIAATIGAVAGGTTMVGAGAGNSVVTGTTTDNRRFLHRLNPPVFTYPSIDRHAAGRAGPR